MDISHDLTQDDTLKCIKTLLGEVKNEHQDKIEDLHEKWTGNVGEFWFSIMGLSASGTLNVNESKVVMSGKLPLAALPFKNKIRSIVMDRAESLLA